MGQHATPDAADLALLQRAGMVLGRADWGRLQRSTVSEYRRVWGRLKRAREGSGDAWRGLEALTDKAGYYYALRAAYTRLAHHEVAAAVQDLRLGKDPAPAMARLRTWVAEAERYPPRPADGRPAAGGGDGAGLRQRGARSKKGGIADLPDGWLDTLWSLASGRGGRHRDAIAALLVTGARPAELCDGVEVRAAPDGMLSVAIPGRKVTAQNGQPWRRLEVAGDTEAARHLRRLALEAGGAVRVRAACSPSSLSHAVAAVAGDRWGERVSAYTVRHQRAADARAAFGGDLDACARWLGHTSSQTQRYYARLPGSGSIRGATPLGAAAPRPVRRPAPRRAREPAAAPGP